MVVASDVVRLYMGAPQCEQKARNFPGDDSYSVTDSRPDTQRTYFVHTSALAAKAEPVARRHCEQWQYPAGPSLPVISKLTTPHRHRAVIMSGGSPTGYDGRLPRFE